jgi:hypothetical protein
MLSLEGDWMLSGLLMQNMFGGSAVGRFEHMDP